MGRISEEGSSMKRKKTIAQVVIHVILVVLAVVLSLIHI